MIIRIVHVYFLDHLHTGHLFHGAVFTIISRTHYIIAAADDGFNSGIKTHFYGTNVNISNRKQTG